MTPGYLNGRRLLLAARVSGSVQRLTVLHPCAAWLMQMLRCTRDTALLHPSDHQPDHGRPPPLPME